jgi:hypothetical protein
VPTTGTTGDGLTDEQVDGPEDEQQEREPLDSNPWDEAVACQSKSWVTHHDRCDFEVATDDDLSCQSSLSQSVAVCGDDLSGENPHVESPPDEEPSPDWMVRDESDAETTSQADEAELAVQEYMARLLRRLRSGEVDRIPPEGQCDPSSQEVSLADEPASEKANPISPDEYTPRSVAPERHADLRAMRELALHTARSALATHASRSIREKTRRLVLYAGLSLVAAGVGWLLPNPTWPWLRHIAVGAGILLSGLLMAAALTIRVRHQLHSVRCANRSSA